MTRLSSRALVLGMLLAVAWACGCSDEQTDAAAGSDACAASQPADIASSQAVTFRITNNKSTEVWVVTEGWLCSAFGITRTSPSPETIYLAGNSLGPQDFCCTSTTGCDYIGHGPKAFQRLAPGETMDLVWDGRGVVADTCAVECAGMNHMKTYLIGWQPVGAGSYSVSIRFVTALPHDCDDAGTTVSCSSGTAFPAYREDACVVGRRTDVAFELQDGADIMVPVSIQ